MAEAFGVAAGALTLIEASAKIISRCKHLIETTRDAPKELRHILVEISSLKATLESLQFLFGNENTFSNDPTKRSELGGALSHCHGTVEELANELDGLSIAQDAQPQISKRRILKESLSWSLKESKVRKLLDATMQHKATMTLALLGDVVRDVQEVKRSVQTIQEGISDSKLRDVCHWLERVNPTYIHNEAVKLRDEQTCRWILRQPDFEQWCSGARRSIWIHGIPGAGKTILSSFINDHLEHLGETSSERTLPVYFYFSYRNPDDQTLAFLGWILSQLSRYLKAIPPGIQRLHAHNSVPKCSDLVKGIEILLSHMNQVFLVVDAADECNNRNELLDCVGGLLKDLRFSKIRILITSRDYLDIREVLEPVSSSISMSNTFVNEDIRTYVKYELQRRPKTKRWPPDLAEEVVDSLTKGANGMFRWAACQIYILQSKRRECDIRQALKELPESLDETYSRALQQIPEDDWPYARKALSWICVHQMLRFPVGIPTTCLMTAVFSHSSMTLLSPTAIQDICGCLTNTSSVQYRWDGDTTAFKTTGLAHYTVKEFLFSDRLASSNLCYFALSEKDVITEYLTEILTQCGRLDLSKPPEPHSYGQFDTYCREAARIAPYDLEQFYIENDDIWQFQLSYLSNPRHPLVKAVENYSEVEDDGAPPRLLCWDINRQTTRISLLSYLLLSMMEDHLAKMAVKFLAGLDMEALLSTPLELITPEGDRVHTNFMEATAIASIYYGSWMTDFTVALMASRIPASTAFMLSMSGHLHGAHLFEEIDGCRLGQQLRAGIDVSGSGFKITPLQLAVTRWDYAGVEALLNAGVDVNGLGNPHGKDLASIDSSKGSCSPLNIIRTSVFCLAHVMLLLAAEDREQFFTCRRRDRGRIEELLVRCGAKDFVGAENEEADTLAMSHSDFV
ncbi:hypothetical protein CC80DRAFT_210542 [Byssothecium circinans]|uniref:NACHT domain-containing protein n=1 Tax=Byssothecium circinans TaxID=147558 RepID=A0A6A5TGU1_9PLEO|nr:hypothetical protein CC80DRAFT_210542 [Byssothecium circinans]